VNLDRPGNFLGSWRQWERSQSCSVFACGLVPALLTLLIRAWVPESPRWLVRIGMPEKARRSLAWALQVSPASLPLPKLDEAATRQTAWSDLFRYARGLLVSWLSNLGMQTTGYGVILWATDAVRHAARRRAGPSVVSVHIFEFGGVRRALCLLRAFRADRLRIAPRETSGTQGSNPSSSSGESLANLIDVSSPVIAGQLLSSRGEKTAARGNCRNLCGGALLARSDEGRG
jgi:hypothetical protein